MYRAKFFLLLVLLVLIGCNQNKRTPVKQTPLLKKVQTTPKEKINNFIFVGMIDQKAGLYKYDFAKKKFERFWSNYNEQVVELSYSPDWKSAFFLTAGHFGKKSVLPFITRVKLYLIDLSPNDNSTDSLRVKFIKRLGDGVQVFTEWENKNNFKVVINRIDKIVATYINQQTFIYNTFGREQLNEIQTYDMTKTGYPKPRGTTTGLISPGGRFKLINKSADTTNIFISDTENSGLNFVVSNGQQLNTVRWSDDVEYLILSTLDVTAKNKTLKTKTPETSALYIYNTLGQQIFKKWEGSGIKNFYIRNDLLIFDNGFGDNSTITIYNYRTQKIFDVIKIRGGCGLRNIPELPDFEA